MSNTKLGRNDYCPCGSGLKYKRCCINKSVMEPKKFWGNTQIPVPVMSRNKKIIIKEKSDIDLLRKTCRLSAKLLYECSRLIAPGVATDEINEYVLDFCRKNLCYPSPLNYQGFPKALCISINEVICHGIPSERRIKEGDIVNIDVTLFQNGFHGDCNATFLVGEVNDKTKSLVKVTEKALYEAIGIIKENCHLGDLGAVIQSIVEPAGFSIVRDYTGHGIGRDFHEPPLVPHYGEAGTGIKLKKGMVFTVEPMINEGKYDCRVLSDGWTAVTLDGKNSAQFEHTVLVTLDGYEILTILD